jgi:hypothetical protein
MIEVLHYEKANKNKIIGFVDIKVTIDKLTMIIRKIAHFQNGNRKWFNLPTFTRDKIDGAKYYLKYWQFELEVHNGQLLELLHEKVKEYCTKNNIQEIEPLNFDEQYVSCAVADDELPF